MLVPVTAKVNLFGVRKKKSSFCNTTKNNKADLKKLILSKFMSYNSSLLLMNLMLLK